MCGDVANTNIFDPNDKKSHIECQKMYEEQVRWAKEAGVDFVVAETINWVDEMKIALKAIKDEGLIAVTKNFARNLGPYGITTNAVAPGAIATPMAVEQSLSDESLLKRVVEATPTGRLGSADEAAATVVFLASEEASFVNGVCLDVNGGWVMT